MVHCVFLWPFQNQSQTEQITSSFFSFISLPFPLTSPLTGPHPNLSRRRKLSRQGSRLKPRLHMKGVTSSDRAKLAGDQGREQGQSQGREAVNRKAIKHMTGLSLKGQGQWKRVWNGLLEENQTYF